MRTHSQVIVVGAGHAGCEAALAAARCGAETLLITISLDAVAAMPCNPSIGGQGKAQLVREIDAMGGIMGYVADATRIQSRLLNTRKGFAVQALRVQSDKDLYSRFMLDVLLRTPGLCVVQGTVTELIIDGGRVTGVRTASGDAWLAQTVILAPGTFLRGLIHIGESSFAAGRSGEPPAQELGEYLLKARFPIMRFKTGTPPRVAADSVDFTGLERQDHRADLSGFSLRRQKSELLPVKPCFLTHTDSETHRVIRMHIHRSALVSGRIKGTGPRYCPSIEDKVNKFPDKSSHKVFLEPEGGSSPEIYLQGLSTSLPEEIQEMYVRTVPGLYEARITRPGYGIEYDVIDPTRLLPTLMSKDISNLFPAGQINGTSGYEEAAAQGLLAGINAAALVLNKPLLVLPPSESFLGLMIEEISTLGITEPYRVFTSRSPLRLHLRMSNAEIRLSRKAFEHNAISSETEREIDERNRNLASLGKIIGSMRVTSDQILEILPDLPDPKPEGRITLDRLLKRPGVSLSHIASFVPGIADLDTLAAIELETRVKYAGYLEQERKEVILQTKYNETSIPETFFSQIPKGLSTEAVQKILAVKPTTFGALARIPGVRAADSALILIKLLRDSGEAYR